MMEKHLREALTLIEKRDKVNAILKKIDESNEWILSHVDGQVPNHQNVEVIRISKQDSHPLFHNIRDMAHKHWMLQYKLITDRLTEIGVQ